MGIGWMPRAVRRGRDVVGSWMGTEVGCGVEVELELEREADMIGDVAFEVAVGGEVAEVIVGAAAELDEDEPCACDCGCVNADENKCDIDCAAAAGFAKYALEPVP